MREKLGQTVAIGRHVAYREVPQDSTGFSPFELIYGRDVRGHFDILREEWLPSQQDSSDIATYVTQLMKNCR